MSSLIVYDVGNTRTKVGYFASPPPSGRFAAAAAVEAWPTGGRPIHPATVPSRVVIGSVVPDAVAGLVASLPDGWPPPKIVDATDFGVRLDVDEPSAVGVDRVANAVAAFALFQRPCVVIDAGTAVTIDAVTVDAGVPVFLGGAILPGLRLMADSLTDRTAQLPRIDPTVLVTLPGRNTADAIAAGVRYGLRGAVQAITAELCTRLGCPPACVAIDGGDLLIIRDWIPESEAREGGLTLAGLALAAHA